MKKILLLLALAASISGSALAADFASMSCSDAKISANAATCSECFNAGSLYYRSDSPIENITQFYDNFSVSGTNGRIMWQDETTVSWSVLNNKFTLGSSIAPNRDDANGFKFQMIPGFWQTAQNAPNTGRIYGYFPAGSTTTYVKSAGGISLNGVSTTAGPSDRNTAMWRIINNAASHEYLGPGLQGPKVDHVQCAFVFPRWCGDGVRDSDKGEQCDDGNTLNGDGCNNLCQPEVAPVCTGLTVTPTSVINGGSITYTCTGSNVTSYSIVAKNPDGTTLTSSTNASGSITLPATPTGTYTVACYVNNQITTPAICQKNITNTTTSEAVCTGLTITPSALTNGGTVSYSCTGNNVSNYSVIFRNPDNSVLQTLTTSTGSVVVPSSITGTYSASCFVNGQGTTPAACTKTFTNNTVTSPTCDNLSVNVSGTTASYTCSGSNVTSYSIVAKNPDGTTLTSSTNASGSITLPATPTGTYTVACYVNNQITTPAICQKNITNTTTSEAVCTGLTITPSALTNGGTVSYSCTGNNVSNYSVIFRNPDNSVLQTLTTSTGSVVVPSSITGTYSASCFVNGQGTTPAACTKTFTNNTVTSPTCDNLSVNVSGTTASYTCSGSNATSYSISLNGSQISTASSGSTVLAYGTHTFVCSVNGSITSSSCQKTVTLTPNQPYPQIQVIKDDADNHDDQQQINVGGAGQFTVTVRNPGQEALDTVNLSDQLVSECNRSASDTNTMILNTGNRDARLDPGESFSYICTRTNANESMFPNNENRICVNGRGVISGNTVNSCDTTRIYFGTPTASVCQNIQLTQNGNQVTANCSPNGGYRLFVLQGKQVINTFQNPQGQFSFALNDGSYKIACLRDGDTGIQPACQQSITVNPHGTNACTFSSSVRYGGAPLQADLNCQSDSATQCTIQIDKDGEPWQTLYDCNTSMTFDQKGYYQATCYLGDTREESCSTDIQVDIMTIIKTGPFLPLLIIVAIGMAGYITYRRRKTV